MRFFAIIVSCSLALTAACSSQARRVEQPENWEETYIKDVLFSNNPTQRTYHRTSAYPVSFYIEDDCVPVTSQNEKHREERLSLYRKHNVGIVDFSRDKYMADRKLQNILTYVSREVPRSATMLLPFPKQRRKSGDGNIVCVNNRSGRNAGNDRALIYHVTRSHEKFETLWKQSFSGNGYRSTSPKLTPNCFISVKARPDNEVMETNVYIFMKDYNDENFRNKSFLGCMVRGTEAAYGLTGIVNKPDDFLLLKEYATRIDAWGEVALDYWIPRPMMAVALYDGPGASWTEVLAEWRRLNKLKENEQ